MLLAPDTSVILRCKKLTEITLVDLDLKENVTWLIAPEVIREVNRVKDRERDNALKRRARIFLTFFEQAMENRDEQFIYAERENAFDYTTNNLDSSVADERLLADLISYKENHAEQSIGILTSDYNLRTRARARGFIIVTPSTSLELVEPKDVATIKAEVLEHELQELRSAAPILDIRFLNAAGFSSIRVAPLPKTDDAWRAPDILGSRYQRKKRFEENSMVILSLIGGDGWQENEKYDEQYDLYQKRVADVARKRWRAENRFLEISLLLTNTGLLNADEIDLRLAIPPDFKVCESRPDMPDWPKAPQRYHRQIGSQQVIGLLNEGLAHRPLPQLTNYRAGITAKPFESRQLSRSDTGTSITYQVRELPQHDNYGLKTFWLQISDDVLEGYSVPIICEIRAKNAPGVKKMTLRVEVSS